MLEKDRIHDDRFNALSDLLSYAREDMQEAIIFDGNVFLVLTEEEMFEAIKINEITQENSTFVGTTTDHDKPYYVYHMGYIHNPKGE